MVDCYLLLSDILLECVGNKTSECDKQIEVYEKYCGKDTHTRAQS